MPSKKKITDVFDEEAIHPIQVVARRTGLSADVIRAWERRYDAVVPKRSPTGRRLYTDEDVQRLRLLGQAIDMGRRIGDVARLPLPELTELIGADQAALEQAPAPPRGARKASSEAPGEHGAYQDHVDACLQATEQLDSVALETALAKAAVACGLPVLLQEVIHKVMVAIGQRWQEGGMRLCHEHMATAVIRSFLGAMTSGNGSAATGFAPVLLVTTPDGQRHELGALMVSLVAAFKGWEPLYLGASTPTDEIAFAAAKKSVKAVALSICYPADDPRLPMVLKKLRGQLPTETTILAGGASVEGYRAALAEIDAVCLGNLDALQLELDRLRSQHF